MSCLEIIDETTSTNSELASRADALKHGHALMALSQTAGRGQRGNTWEAEPGRNVTMSLLLRPAGLDVRQQFSLSEAVALGVVDTLASYGVTALVKWPNDIYVGDKKICGILIENSLEGTRIGRSIAGIGLNVNQHCFLSPAPNPVSMWQLLGTEYEVAEVGRMLVDDILRLCDTYLGSSAGRDVLHERYMRHMWRNDGGFHPYVDVASGQRFMAVIADVALTGHLTLRDADNSVRTYAFKEVQAIIG